MIFLKLGGSLITDKTVACCVRRDVLTRLAQEVREAIGSNPSLQLVLGHGSGSFGHWAAAPYGTRHGVYTREQWQGFTIVAAAAARLNRIVADAFLEAGVPVFSIQPSASARCRALMLQYLDTWPIQRALTCGLVPLLYGDVALDEVQGGTIISTEDLFVYLAQVFRPSRILLVGEVPGVLAEDGALVPLITPKTFPAFRAALSASRGVDVTGGMADKVARMVELVQRLPGVRVQILSGKEPGLLTRALLNPDLSVGTCIQTDERPAV